MLRFVLALTTLCVSACNSGSEPAPRSADDESSSWSAARGDPAFRADIETICDVDARAHTAQLDELELAQRRDDYLVEHIRQPDTIYFLTMFRSKPDNQRAELLAAEARALKLDSCLLGDSLAGSKSSK